MLYLQRNGRFNELYKCSASGELIGPGEYYYEDDEDGAIIKASVWRKLMDKKKEDEFDKTKLTNAENERDYQALLKQAEMEFLQVDILNRTIAGKGGY